MPGRVWPCPDCPFRSTSKRGIQIHWKCKHTPNFPNPVKYRQQFLESLSQGQFRLLGTRHESHRMDAGPAEGFLHAFARDPGPSAVPKRPASFTRAGYAPTPQKLSCRPRSVSSQSELPSSRFDSDSGSLPVPRTGTPQNLVAPDSRAHDDQPPSVTQLFYCAPGGSPGLRSDEQDVEIRPLSPQDSSAAYQDGALDLYIGPREPENRSTQKDTEQASSATVEPRTSRQSQNDSRASSRAKYSEISDPGTSFPQCFARDLKTGPKSTGRSLLRSLWPTCLSIFLAELPNAKSDSSRGENELTAGNYLTLLGNCPILDYDATSPWDIVLRCSLCGMPVSGVQCMETHIREHLQQQAQNFCEVQHGTPGNFVHHRTSCATNIMNPGAAESRTRGGVEMSPIIIPAASESPSPFSVRSQIEISAQSMARDFTAQ